MVIQAHAQARRTVILKYRKQEDGSLIVREIEPYSIRLKNTRKYGRRRYLYGYDLFRGEIRAFILGNMQSVRGSNNTFSPRWEVEF
jgi:predicted DNA-binding transcriptional regulator YafY